MTRIIALPSSVGSGTVPVDCLCNSKEADSLRCWMQTTNSDVERVVWTFFNPGKTCGFHLLFKFICRHPQRKGPEGKKERCTTLQSVNMESVGTFSIAALSENPLNESFAA